MASTYSALKIELIATGEQSGTWGATTNVNLGDAALGEAITGSADVAFTGADVTITLTDTNTTQSARNLRLNLTGTSGGARNLILGSGCQIEKLYLVNNGLADAVTVKNTTGTGIAVAAGKSMFVYNNGTNVVEAVNYASSISTGAITCTSLTDSGLTSGRVTYAGASGLLTDSANLTFNGNTLTSSNGTGANLVLNSTADIPYVAFNHSSASKFLIGASAIVGGGTGYYDFYGAAAIGQRFWTGASQRMTILSTGEVGIGTSSPTALLQLFKGSSGSGAIADSALALQYDATTTYGRHFMDGNGNYTIYAPSGGVSGGNINFWATNAMLFRTAGTVTDTAKMQLDASGNLGLGVTPSAWATVTAMQVKATSLGGYSSTGYLGANCYYNANWKYINTLPAARYEINAGDTGAHQWFTAPSGTAGNAITFTQAMTLDSSGNLGIGTSSPQSKLHVATTTSETGVQLTNNNATVYLGAVYSANNFANGTVAGQAILRSGVGIAFSTTSGASVQATLDGSGNLGLGVTPSAWGTVGYIAMQFPSGGSISGYKPNNAPIIHLSSNLYYDDTNDRYVINGAATRYSQNQGVHSWSNAASGTAGNVISFSERMRIDSSGNVGIGTSNPSSYGKLAVDGTIINVSAANASPFTQQRISVYNDGGNWGYLGYGNDAIMRIVYANTVNSYSLLFGTTSATNNTGTFTETLRISDTGALVLKGGTSAPTGVGVTFPATQVVSPDANTLDDYEEGTWTPTQGSGLTVVGAFSSSGRYVKIGKTVMLIGSVAGATTVALSSNGELCGGLPFTAAIAPYPLALLNCENTKSGAGVSLGTNISECSAMTASSNIKFTITYFV